MICLRICLLHASRLRHPITTVLHKASTVSLQASKRSISALAPRIASAESDQATVHYVQPTGWRNDPDQEIWRLSDLDHQMPYVFLKHLFVYKTGKHANRDGIVNNLKESLEVTLSQCRTLTGVLKKEDGEMKIVKSRESSVLFLVKDLSHTEMTTSIEDLETAGFPPQETCREAALGVMNKLTTTPTMTVEQPVCAIQVTWVPGGMILTFGYHHFSMDGGGLSTFLRQWANNSMAICRDTEPPTWDFENLNRSRLNGKFVPEKCRVPSPPPLPAAVAQSLVEPLPQHPVVLYFNQPSIARLKVLANAGGSVSSYDAITALLWRTQTRARLSIFDSDPRNFAILGQAVDLRNRFQLPLPAKLLANASFAAITPGVPVELALADGKLPYLASIVRQSHTNVNQQAAMDRANLVAMLQDKTLAAWSGRRVPRFAMAMTDMRFSGLSELDFGFGRPIATRNLHQPGHPCVMQRPFLGPNEDALYGLEAEVEVQVPVDVPCLETFIRDAELLQYASVIAS